MVFSFRPLPALLALALAPLAAAAQHGPAPAPLKFGQVDAKDLTAAPFVADSAAAAVVLGDYGTTGFQYVSNDFQLVSERFTRIKILKKAGFSAATVEVPLYHSGPNAEKLSSLRGVTYNLVGGKVVKTKLDVGTSTFTEERTPNVRVRKFTLPDVREGAVIEYSYSVNSDFYFNFQDWTFQREIPVRWSEFRASIPEYFMYKKLVQGYHALAVQQEEEGSQTFTIHTGGGISNGFGNERQASSSEMVTARATNYHWAMQDVPAFRDEPYMTTSEDYVDRISFQLSGLKFPGQGYQAVADTWSKIEMELLADDNFGQQLDRAGFLKEQLLPLAAKYPEVHARAVAVRALVLGGVRYNGTDRYSTTASLRKAWDAHSGSAADVNLLLLAALRGAGLPAQPVLLSTRAHGRIDQNQPLVARFNYVVAQLTLPDGHDLLLDATEPLLPAGVLPERCLNQLGRLIMKDPAQSHWVALPPAQRFVHYQQVSLRVDAQGNLAGKVHEEHGGYSSVDERQKLTSQGEKKYLTQLAAPHGNWTVPALKVGNRDDVTKPLTLEYEFSQPADDNTTADALYLSPLRDFGSEQNPFRHDDRLFPVDFAAPQDETTMITLTLPEGYELAETPKPAMMALPDGGGRYVYNVAAAAPGTVQITSRLTLSKPVYAAAEYTTLREFYRLMLEKQAQKLIIKKKA